MAPQRRRTLPPVSPKAPGELRPFLSAIQEIIETGEGIRGDAMDRKVTLRDLVDYGIATPKVQGSTDAGFESTGSSSTTKDLSSPPVPARLTVTGSHFGINRLEWDEPRKSYKNHGWANIYRASEDNFANALIIAREPGTSYNDLARNELTGDPSGYYYWISYSSVEGVEGPPGSPDGAYAKPLDDGEMIAESLKGRVGQEQLDADLSQRLGSIPLVRHSSAAGPVAGAEIEVLVASVTVDIDVASSVFVSFNCSMTGSSGARLGLYIDGVKVNSVLVDEFPAMTCARLLAAGSHTIAVKWPGDSVPVSISNIDLYTSTTH